MQTTRFTFNEKLKRLEPIGNLCQFCNKDFSVDMSDNHFAPIYNEKERTSIIVYNSVKFQKILIGIPRCKSCEKIHNKSTTYSLIIGFVLAVLVVIAVNHFYKYEYWNKIFYSVVGFFATFLLSAYNLANFIIARQGVLSEIEGVEREPQVIEMLREGWTLSQPSA